MLDIILYILLRILYGIILAILVPCAVYLIIKAGTFGFLKAKQQFREEEKKDGKNKRT